MSVLSVCMYVYQLCAWCLQRSEEGLGSLVNGVMDVCVRPCRCWEQNLLSSVRAACLATELSLQLQKLVVQPKQLCCHFPVPEEQAIGRAQ